MTVQTLLGSMSQKELCHWIAYHKLEQEKWADKKGAGKTQNASASSPQKAAAEWNGGTQEQRDAFFAAQVMLIARNAKKKKRKR